MKTNWKKRRIGRGMEFMSKELAEARVEELKLYGRPAIRLGKKVYEVLGWSK